MRRTLLALFALAAPACFVDVHDTGDDTVDGVRVDWRGTEDTGGIVEETEEVLLRRSAEHDWP